MHAHLSRHRQADYAPLAGYRPELSPATLRRILSGQSEPDPPAEEAGDAGEPEA